MIRSGLQRQFSSFVQGKLIKEIGQEKKHRQKLIEGFDLVNDFLQFKGQFDIAKKLTVWPRLGFPNGLVQMWLTV